MAETPPQEPISSVSDTEPLQYWCYHCDKRVSIETLTDLPDIICYECKNGFVESISAAIQPEPPSAPATTTTINREPSFSNQFLQILRLIAEAARDNEVPPPPPPDSDPPESDDFLRIEFDGWDNENDNDEEDDDQDEDEINFGNNNGNRSDNEIGNQEEEDPDQENQEDIRRRRRDVLRLRIRDFATRATSGRNRILDWSEILMGLEDNTMEFRVEMPEWDGYIGNPEDYVDADGYEALLQNLAESDGGARRGAPPASKSAVSSLKMMEIKPEEEVLICAICKESVSVGEKAKKLPCEHGYHGDCIETWLVSRNTCPVCRFELPTDDAEYEEQKKKRSNGSTSSSSSV